MFPLDTFWVCSANFSQLEILGRLLSNVEEEIPRQNVSQITGFKWDFAWLQDQVLLWSGSVETVSWAPLSQYLPFWAFPLFYFLLVEKIFFLANANKAFLNFKPECIWRIRNLRFEWVSKVATIALSDLLSVNQHFISLCLPVTLQCGTTFDFSAPFDNHETVSSPQMHYFLD